ncbi:hypothetical protein ROG8370_03851 [Roseovarius gaetbuli]|uniref:LapA adhesin domain-containing protein n=1 Tax=Roseovarius gaetbuli TaxID=1356575 RepID=A0A1X7AD92_9RHOB|nr:DUF11 domain-containing protein [Roseovarius gaetbuli]SLN76162.1 hypothetical protein ROG8370_03851 [Roseovarius gaetbuli]
MNFRDKFERDLNAEFRKADFTTLGTDAWHVFASGHPSRHGLWASTGHKEKLKTAFGAEWLFPTFGITRIDSHFLNSTALSPWPNAIQRTPNAVSSAIFGEQFETNLTVGTDLEDYAPGSTATITLNGVELGGSVRFEIDHLNAGADGIYATGDEFTYDIEGGEGHDPWTVTDGGAGDLDNEVNGSITTTWYVNPDDSLDETFLLTAEVVDAGTDGIIGTEDDIATGERATHTFTDSAGSYSLDFQAADPGDYLGTGNAFIPFPGNVIAPIGRGDGNVQIPNADSAGAIESLNPTDMALGQVVPFELAITVTGPTEPEGGVITVVMGWNIETTNGGDFGYDDVLGVIGAFIDTSDSSHVDPGGDATVDSFSWSVIGAEIVGVFTISGLDEGDSVILEPWLVLDDTIAEGIGSNVQSRLIDAATGPDNTLNVAPNGTINLVSSGSTVNTGNQTVPLLQPQDFFNANVDLAVTISDNPDPIFPGDTLVFTVEGSSTTSSTSVANSVVVYAEIDPNVTFVSATNGGFVNTDSGDSIPDGAVQWDVGSLLPGQIVTFDVTVTVNEDAPTDDLAGEDLISSATITTISDDTNAANNNDSEPTNVIGTTTVTLDDVTVLENGTITYTASVNNAPQGAFSVTLDNGVVINFADGALTGASEPQNAQGEDPYLDGETFDVTIASTAGGTFEALDTTDTATVTINDTIDTTTVTLNDPTVDEGGNVTITASVDNAPQGDLTLTLSNGESITILSGETSGQVSFPAPPDDPYIDAVSFDLTITNAAGGNYEDLNTSDTATVTVNDTTGGPDDLTTVTLDDVTVLENGTITYTASVNNAPQGAFSVTLDNGVVINFADGALTGASEPQNAQGEDPYLDGETFDVTIASTAGGTFEALDTTDTATVTINDTIDTTTVTLNDVTVDGACDLEGLGNPGNGKPVGGSPWDGITGASGNNDGPNGNGSPSANPMNGQREDTEENQPPGAGGPGPSTGGNSAANDASTESGEENGTNPSNQNGTSLLISIIATVDNAPQGDLTLTLSNGESITILSGETSGYVTFEQSDVDVGSFDLTIIGAEGGNYEHLDTSDTATVTFEDTCAPDGSGNPGNGKPVGGSPWDGITGASGNNDGPNGNGSPSANPMNGQREDTEENQPPGAGGPGTSTGGNSAATDASTESDPAAIGIKYNDVETDGPGVHTPEGWGRSFKLLQFWDGMKGNEQESFLYGEVLYTVDADGDGTLNPDTLGLLVGDYNQNGTEDAGEQTLFISHDDALALVNNEADTPKQDKRDDLAQQTVATWLNYLAGNNLGEDTDEEDSITPRDFLNDSVSWLVEYASIDELIFNLHDDPIIRSKDDAWSEGAEIMSALDEYNNHGSVNDVSFALDTDAFFFH